MVVHLGKGFWLMWSVPAKQRLNEEAHSAARCRLTTLSGVLEGTGR